MGISWRDMGVVNRRGGQPEMRLTGWAAERLAAMTPPGMTAHVHVSLTDDHPWAQAFVVIEARAGGGGDGLSKARAQAPSKALAPGGAP